MTLVPSLVSRPRGAGAPSVGGTPGPLGLRSTRPGPLGGDDTLGRPSGWPRGPAGEGARLLEPAGRCPRRGADRRLPRGEASRHAPARGDDGPLVSSKAVGRMAGPRPISMAPRSAGRRPSRAIPADEPWAAPP